MQDKLVRAIEAQAVYDSLQETQYELELADIIFAAIKGWRVRSSPEIRIKLEEGKVCKFGLKSSYELIGHFGVLFLADAHCTGEGNKMHFSHRKHL